MEERLREVLYEMNFETLKQSHRYYLEFITPLDYIYRYIAYIDIYSWIIILFSVCNNAVYFIINDETAVLPLARVKFCRDKTGTIDNLAGLSGKL